MITKHDLQEAILECLGKRNPDAGTCIKLAAFYTIMDHLFPDATKMIEPQPMYSFSPGPVVEGDPAMIDYQSGTEFSRLIDGRDPAGIWPVVDDLVTAVQALHPRLYNSFIDQLQE